MAGIDEAALNAAASWDTEPISILAPGAQAQAAVPETWWPLVESADPEDRKRIAIQRWDAEFLDLIPRFAEALRTQLVDVRVAKHNWLDSPSLDYVLRTEDGELAVWVGEDPRTFGAATPPYFESVPPPASTFLQHTHAGFTTWDGESCGLIAPRHMTTLAAKWGAPDTNEILEWEEDDYEFPGTQRLLLVTEGGSDASLCVSPDLPDGLAITYFEPDFEVKSFGEALDEFMNLPL
ncbi:hypothetical protein ACRCUN_00165 [Mycobacterium sp. LTG2003]